jgi:hypothetical protein
MCGRSSFRDAMTAPALRGQKLYSRTRLSGVYSVWTVAYVGRCAGWLADMSNVAVRFLQAQLARRRRSTHCGRLPPSHLSTVESAAQNGPKD